MITPWFEFSTMRVEEFIAGGVNNIVSTVIVDIFKLRLHYLGGNKSHGFLSQHHSVIVIHKTCLYGSRVLGERQFNFQRLYYCPPSSDDRSHCISPVTGVNVSQPSENSSTTHAHWHSGTLGSCCEVYLFFFRLYHFTSVRPVCGLLKYCWLIRDVSLDASMRDFWDKGYHICSNSLQFFTDSVVFCHHWYTEPLYPTLIINQPHVL